MLKIIWKNEKENFQLRKFYTCTNKNHITGFLDPSPGGIYHFLSSETQICGNMEGFRDMIGEFLEKLKFYFRGNYV